MGGESKIKWGVAGAGEGVGGAGVGRGRGKGWGVAGSEKGVWGGFWGGVERDHSLHPISCVQVLFQHPVSKSSSNVVVKPDLSISLHPMSKSSSTVVLSCCQT